MCVCMYNKEETMIVINKGQSSRSYTIKTDMIDLI